MNGQELAVTNAGVVRGSSPDDRGTLLGDDGASTDARFHQGDLAGRELGAGDQTPTNDDSLPIGRREEHLEGQLSAESAGKGLRIDPSDTGVATAGVGGDRRLADVPQARALVTQRRASGHRTRAVLLGTAGGRTWWGGSRRQGISSAVAVEDAVYLVDFGDGWGRRYL